MSIQKKILKSVVTQWIIALLASSYIRFVYVTSKWQWAGMENVKEIIERNQNCIVAFWHGRMMMIYPIAGKSKRKVFVMISFHRDGMLIARIMRFFGFRQVRGSSTRGGMHAYRHSLRVLQRGYNLAITPDGPKGPNEQVHGHIMSIAKDAGVPIVPLSYAISRHKRFRSWDRFMLALPFSKGVLIAGEPMYIDKNASIQELEEAKTTLQNRLKMITLRADELTQ